MRYESVIFLTNRFEGDCPQPLAIHEDDDGSPVFG